MERFKSVLKLISSIYNIKVNTIVYDNHPYNWGRSFEIDVSTAKNVKRVGVYHHHAHIVSCMYKKHIDDKVIGVALGGTGYGDDKKIWGGEIPCNDSGISVGQMIIAEHFLNKSGG